MLYLISCNSAKFNHNILALEALYLVGSLPFDLGLKVMLVCNWNDKAVWPCLIHDFLGLILERWTKMSPKHLASPVGWMKPNSPHHLTTVPSRVNLLSWFLVANSIALALSLPRDLEIHACAENMSEG